MGPRDVVDAQFLKRPMMMHQCAASSQDLRRHQNETGDVMFRKEGAVEGKSK